MPPSNSFGYIFHWCGYVRHFGNCRPARSGSNSHTQSNNTSNSHAKKSAPDYTKPVRFVSATATTDSDQPATPPADYNVDKVPSHCKPMRFVAAANTADDQSDDDAPSQPKTAKPNSDRAAAAGQRTTAATNSRLGNRPRHQPQVRLQRQQQLPTRSGSFGGFVLFDANASTAKTPQYGNLLQTSAAKQRRTLVTKLAATASGKQ